MNDYVGQVLCCGQIPKFGHHKFHLYQGRREAGFGFYCDKCQKSAAILSRGMGSIPVPHETVAFATIHWNKQFSPWTVDDRKVKLSPLNAPAGFEGAELQWTHSFIGGETNGGFPFVLIRYESAKSKYDDGRLAKLEVINVFGDCVDLSELLTLRNISAYLSEVSWHGGGGSTVHRSIRFSFYNTAYRNLAKFKAICEKLKFPFEKS